MTRPAADSERFAGLWRGLVGADARVIIAPVTAVEPVAPEGAWPAADRVILTSAHAVAAAVQLGRPAWCVGERTAAAARAAGLPAEAHGPDADGLVASILASGLPGTWLHLRGREGRGEVAARLTAAGVPCSEVVVYAQRPVPLSEEAMALLAGSEPVLLPVFSPNSARRLAAALRRAGHTAPLLVAAISPAAATAWNEVEPARLSLAGRPDAEGMLAALQQLCEAVDSP